MRWQRLLLWSGTGLLILIVAAISWLLLADLGSFKPQIERWASEKTGRRVSIAGDLVIDLAADSTLIAERLTISNADWAAEPEMLVVGRVEVRFDLGSLLSGPIVVEFVDLDDTEISLARPENGAPNWALLPPSTRPPEDDDDGAQRGIHFQQIDIDNFALSYTTPADTQPMLLEVESATQKYRDDDFLEISMAGSLNDRKLELAGEIGSWTGLLQGKDVRFDLGARLDSFTLDASGEVDDVLQPHRPRISFTAAAPDVNDLLQALGVEHEGKGGIDISGTLSPIEQGPLKLDIAGHIGSLDIRASGEFSDLQNLQEIDIDLLASGEDVRPILEAVGIRQAQPAPFMINIDATRSGSTLIVNEADMVFGQARFGLSARLPQFPQIDDSEIRLRIDGPDIERFREMFDLTGGATGPFSASLTIDAAEDGFELFDVDIKTSLGELQGNGRIGDAPEYIGTALDFSVSSDNLAAIGSAYAIPGLPERPVEIHGGVQLDANGIRTVSPVVATSNGTFMEVEGLIQPVAGILGSDLAFTLKGPDLADLIGAFSDNTGVPELAYDLNGQLQVRDDGYRFRGVTGKLGTSDLELDGLLVPKPGIAGSRVSFAARGAAISEVIDQFGDLGVRPGPYEFSGAMEFRPEQIVFSDIELNRATGNIDLNAELSLPVSERSATFNLRASGPNVQSVLYRFENFEAEELPFNVDVDGKVRGSAWQFDNLDVQVGVARLTAAGGLDLEGKARASRFTIGIDIPDTAALGKLDGRRLRSQSLTLNGIVTGGDGELRADNLRIKLGESDIAGDIRYVAGVVPRFDVRIVSNAIMFGSLLEEPEEQLAEHETALDDGRLIPQIEVPFDAMAKVDVLFDIKVRELQRDTMHLTDVVAQAELSGGRLEVASLRFHGREGALAARGWLDPGDGQGAAQLELVAREFALSTFGFANSFELTGDVDIKLESTGNNLRTLLGNVTGVFFLNSRGGRAGKNRSLEALYGGALQEIIGTINPFSKAEKYTEFECIVTPIEINSGILSGNPNSLIATSKVQIMTKSRVNLRTEKIEVNIQTTPKQGISISAGEFVNPYIKVVGTLAAPRLAVDEKGVLLSGGAAFATGGLSILARAAWARLARSKDPCTDTVTTGMAALGTRLPTLTVTLPE